jgi:formylglycine-generating enzyme required for sulfatase activity
MASRHPSLLRTLVSASLLGFVGPAVLLGVLVLWFRVEWWNGLLFGPLRWLTLWGLAASACVLVGAVSASVAPAKADLPFWLVPAVVLPGWAAMTGEANRSSGPPHLGLFVTLIAVNNWLSGWYAIWIVRKGNSPTATEQPPNLSPDLEREALAYFQPSSPKTDADAIRTTPDALTREPANSPDGGREQRPNLVNSIGMELILVPAGSFQMGSPETEAAAERSDNVPPGADERPQHLVRISGPFYLGIYLVTQRQYQAVMGRNPAHFNTLNGGGPDHPVECVTWEDAQHFCERLSALPQEQQAGRVYRLPSEAEWEYTCRAGTDSPFCWGDTATSAQANLDGSLPYGDAPPGPNLGRTTQVGAYPANSFGLFDVHGNVWEWCQDYYDPFYYHESEVDDPQGPRAGNRKCARGGSWSNSAADCRSACRDYWYGTQYARNTIGFRVAMTIRQ